VALKFKWRWCNGPLESSTLQVQLYVHLLPR